jgi:iron complex transport system ATP-binding protein
VVKQDISLRGEAGEMVALIGGNGIGKSTLLKTIAGFQSQLSGQLLVRGRNIADFGTEELARELSFVSTEIVRVANLTVRELVGLGRFPHTNWFGQLTGNDQDIVEKAIVQVGLSGYEDRLVTRISDGERQRAMIARALAQDTPIIVLDEPTAFLDISNKYEIVRILHQLAAEHGKCIIFSTHDLNTALTMADRIWLMLKEEVVEGIPEELAAGGYFDALFQMNPHLYFDADNGDFRIRKENRGVITLAATGAELKWAARALDRMGFIVDFASPLPLVPSSPRPFVPSSPSPSVPQSDIQVVQQANGWKLSHAEFNCEAETLGELCRELRKIRPRLKS